MTSNAVLKAELRAKISAFLKNNPGKHKVSDVAVHIGSTGRSTGQLLARMAKNKLIPLPEKEGGEWAYEWKENHEHQPAVAKEPRRVSGKLAIDDDGLMAILGAVALFKRGTISQEVFVNALKDILRGTK